MMTNFCILDAMLVCLLVAMLVISVEAAITINRKVGYSYLFGSLLVLVLLYVNVYKSSAEAHIAQGSTWARLHLFLQNYIGNAWIFWLIVALYVLLVIFGLILGFKIYKVRRKSKS